VDQDVPRMSCEAQHSEADSQLEALLIEGFCAGEEIPVSADFWRRLKKKATEPRRCVTTHPVSKRELFRGLPEP
jgi:hypothetical protein